MKKEFYIVCFLLLIGFISCNREETKNRSDLNIFTGSMTGYFSDKGAWFCFPIHDNEKLGSGVPLILSDSNGYYFREELFTLSVLKNNQTLAFRVTGFSLPEKMMQVGENTEMKITIETVFSSKQTALLACSFENKTKEKLNILSILKIARYDSIGPGDKFSYNLGNAELTMKFEKDYEINNNILTRQITLAPYGKETEYIAVSHRFKEGEAFSDIDFEKAETVFREDKMRWKAYLKPYTLLPSSDQVLAAKCIQTLITNWRSAAGALKHDGLFPSYAYKGFHGFWAWDAWKHAVALAFFEPDLAKNQIRAMYDYQDEQGMIPDCIFRDTTMESINRRDTKPPLSGWAIYEVYRKTGDTAFVREMLPKLIRYHEWWLENRDPDSNGLCAYGSTDGTRIAAAWESGMDNAVRFDSAQLIKINDYAWSFDQESVDLNAYLYAEKKYIARLAKIAGKQGKAEYYRAQLKPLKEKIQQRFYDRKSGYFYDYNTEKKHLIKVAGPEAWITLWAGVADGEQAEAVISKILDTACFNTYVPFPTLSASDPSFEPENGYWRGPVWIDQAWFALEGMKRYGYTDEYNLMKNKLLTHAKGLMKKGVPLSENYDPLTGEGLNARHFSWTAAHLLMLLREDADE